MLRPVCNRLPLAQALEKAGLKAIDRDRAAVVQQRRAMAKGVAVVLAELGPVVADQLLQLLDMAEKAQRAGADPVALADAALRARKALAELDITEQWTTAVDVFQAPLEATAREGAQAGLAQIGVKAEDVQVIAGDQAAAWGRQRAAEMVGMRRTADGELIPNPSAKWRIDESTREMLRGLVEQALVEGQSADDLRSAILDSAAFSEARAETIARTELAKADMAGAMVGYRVSGVVAGKTWSTSQDEDVSDECRQCEEQGVIGLADAFINGEDSAPGHPNCRCTVLPVLDDEMPPTVGKTTKDHDMTKLFASIEKADKQDDGTIKVYGFASAEVVDSDGETVTADAMKAARDGYMAFANVREMHDPKKAAGVAIEYDVQEDGRTWFGAHVVDPVAVLKVETGVYKGFSIGAKVPPGGREGKLIKSIDLREVSLVDRPANPEAVFTMFKADGATEQEEMPADEVRKGLYEMRDFADVLRSIGYLASSAEWEAQAEGDKSPLPAALRDWLAQGVVIFKAMAEEETNELLAQLRAMVPAPVVVDTIAAADGGGDLVKAGKRFSAQTKGALKAAHEACKAADKALADLGYDKDDEAQEGEGGDAGKAATGDDLQKAQAAEAEAATEVAKAIGVELPEPSALSLAKAAVGELLTLRKAHADLLATPAAAKGALKAVTVSKTVDRDGTDQNEPAPVVKADGAVDDVATLIKAAQGKPVRIS